MCVCVFHFIFVVGDSHACQSFLSVHLFNVDYMFFLNLLRLVIIFFIFLYLYLLNTNMLISKVFGYLGGIGTTISFLPQVVKIYKQNNNDGLSIYMFLIHLSGVSSWVIYGIYIEDIIVILYNSITLLLICLIIFKYINNEYNSRSNVITT